ncbi:MAG: DUF3772 domain-containing protein [Pseudochelatococcus sp.]|jgi:potassium efflux system protein|uniref:DUF3772 domain-containing protein n=1 Tax=Pseudochelatococcus sp. TaxID=2020869 RepID=UPI003D8BEE6E
MRHAESGLPQYLSLLIACLFCTCLFCAWAGASSALAVTDPAPLTQQLDTIRASLDQIEKDVDADEHADPGMSRLRQSIDGLRAEILAVIGDLTPRAQALNAQLEQLGAKPEDDAQPESESIAGERKEKSAALADLNAGIKLAEALLVHANQISTRISDLRRTAFTRSLLARSASLWSPSLWRDVATALPGDFRALRGAFGNWAWDVRQRFERGGLSYVLVAGLVGALLHWLRLRVLPRLTWRDPADTEPSRLERVLKALGITLARSVPVAGANLVLYMALDSENLLGGRLAPVISWLLFGIVFLVFMRALADALFAPELTAWRLFEVDDEAARHMSRVTNLGTIVILAGTVLQSMVAAISATLPLVVVTDGIRSLAVAGLMAWALRGLKRLAPPEVDDFGPYVPAETDYRGITVAVCWLAVLAIVLAVTIGYIAFASFVVDQVVWILSVTGIYFLLRVFTEELLEKLPGRHSRTSLFLQTNMGLRRRAVEQLSVLTAGIFKLVLLVIAVLLVVAPWGMETHDLYAPLQAVRMGFSIGEISIAPADIVSAALTFAVVTLVTHALQRWLENKYLPTTGFDAGIRNSIRTAVGYVGFFIAVALACTQLGLSLSRISLVAGALSVGVGFGLQSIVNNFVSGLILLWERPIRVGDWVVVGSDQGYVRRINVRATEIETFDRSSVIIPNSNLVSGVVKNRLHTGRTGRIIISIGVAYDADENEVRRLMVDCARDHSSVLKHPEPVAHLMEFTDSKMRFELWCFIGNIQESTSVTSQLNLAVLQRLRARGFIPPRPLEAEPWGFGRRARETAPVEQPETGNDTA